MGEMGRYACGLLADFDLGEWRFLSGFGGYMLVLGFFPEQIFVSWLDFGCVAKLFGGFRGYGGAKVFIGWG
jgi:hypothetical protein